MKQIRKSIKRKSIKRKSIKRKSIKRKSIKRKSIKRKSGGGKDDEVVCPVCYLTKQELTEQDICLGQLITNDASDICNHEICKNCFDNLPFEKKCPLCRKYVSGIKCGDIIYGKVSDQYIVDQMIRILGSNDWEYYNNNNINIIGVRYVLNNGLGIALPRTRTFYGALKKQKYACPVSNAQLTEIKRLLPSYYIQMYIVGGSIGYVVGASYRRR